MDAEKKNACVICDETAFAWLAQVVNGWNVKYLFCLDENMKQSMIEMFGLFESKTNENENVNEFLDSVEPQEVDVVLLLLTTSCFHEEVISYIIKQKKFFFVLSSNVPTYSIEKLRSLRGEYNNFNSLSEIVYDVKEDFKKENPQFYYNIHNSLLSQKIFQNLKEMIPHIGFLQGFTIECTFIPLCVESKEDSNTTLFSHAIHITSLIQFLFEKPKSVLAKNYIVKDNDEIISCISGSAFLSKFNGTFNISVNSINPIFHMEIHGQNGFLNLNYNHTHKCFQLQRCLNHYEYPHLYTEDANKNSLSELRYFLDTKYCCNKYINYYIDSIYTTLCLWKSEGLNMLIQNLDEVELVQNEKTTLEENCISATACAE